MTLHYYLGLRFLVTFLAVFGIFLAIFLLSGMVEQIRKFDSALVGFVEIIKLTLLGTPEQVIRILPLIVVIAALVMFRSLARSSELMVIRASGRAIFQTLFAPILISFGIGLLTVAVLNPITASTSRQYDIVAGRNTGNGASALSISAEGLWLREGEPGGQVVIHAAQSNPDGTELFDVTFFGFGSGGAPNYRVEAESAKIVNGAWHLRMAKQWPLGISGNPERESVFHEELNIPSTLTVDHIRNSFGTPNSISIWELSGFIERLDVAGLSTLRHRVWFNMELALPLMLVAMTMVGAGFSMRHNQFTSIGMAVSLALCTGFTLHFVRNFARILGETGQIPVLLAAWGPSVAAIMLAAGIVLNLGDS